MLPPSPGWTQSGRYQQSSTVRASSACRQPPLPPHRLQPMVLNDGPTPAAVRLCCRAAAGSNRGTRSSDWQRGVPTASYSECGRTGSSGVHGRSLFFFFFFFPLSLSLPSILGGRKTRRGGGGRPAAHPPPCGCHGNGVASGPNVAWGDVTQCSPPHHTAEGRPESRHLTPLGARSGWRSRRANPAPCWGAALGARRPSPPRPPPPRLNQENPHKLLSHAERVYVSNSTRAAPIVPFCQNTAGYLIC